MENYLKIAVPAPLYYPLTYSSEINYPRGCSLLVPLKGKEVDGVVIGGTDSPGDFEIKPVIRQEEARPHLPEPFIKWLEWLSDYYLYPIGLVTSLAFPPLKKKKYKRRKSSPIIPSVAPYPAPTHTREQRKCIESISQKSGFRVHLLHGVTGSGKTEVYLKLLEKTIDEGKRGMVIVPEISLTPQLIGRFSARFPDQISVIHSELNNSEKTNQWWNVVDGKKKILIGARSALFCPIEDLGMIVIDEEHEASFKQDHRLTYHARDAAIKLCQLYDCPVILGSATPSLETWRNAKNGKYHYHAMTLRVSERKMPHICVVDMKIKKSSALDIPFWMSPTLYQQLTENLKQSKQAILFLNRRGVAQVTVCTACGHMYQCPNCAISLTLHGKQDLLCHYCQYTQPRKNKCAKCQSSKVISLGMGTELIETDLQKLFPKAVIARADRDEVQNRETLEAIIKDMESGKIDILVGTQMIAKGLDFPQLTLVGLVMADVGFNLPDFRSHERSFQLLTQVSGRAGRHSEEPGQVIIQTYNPQHPSITTANNYDSFVACEMPCRQEMGYPPFTKLASIRIQGSHVKQVVLGCQAISHRAQKLIQMYDNYSAIQILGPAPAPICKLYNKFRYHFLLKSPTHLLLNQFCRQILTNPRKWTPRGVTVSAEIDPVNML